LLGLFLLSFINPSAAAPRKQIRRFTPGQLQQFLDVLARSGFDMNFSGSHWLRFRYGIYPSHSLNKEERDLETLTVVVYGPSVRKGAFMQFELHRSKPCMKLEIFQDANYVVRDGGPWLEELLTGLDSVVRGEVEGLKRYVLPTPLVTVRADHAPKTCAEFIDYPWRQDP